MIEDGLLLTLHSLTGEYERTLNGVADDLDMQIVEGPFQLTFMMKDSITELEDFFGSKMMHMVRLAWQGELVFEGFIYSQELTHGREASIKDMDYFTNAVKVQYTSGTGNAYTSWYTDDVSIGIYGRIEKLVTISSDSSVEAQERAEFELRYYNQDSPVSWTSKGNPIDLSVQEAIKTGHPVKPKEAVNLYVTCLGRIALGNRYHTDGESTVITTTVSAEIERLLGDLDNGAGWLSVGDIDQNDTVVAENTPTPIGIWDRVVELSKLRDPSENFYTLSVRPNGEVYYKQATFEPIYEKYPYPRGIRYTDGTLPRWEAVPGFIRNIDKYAARYMPDYWLPQGIGYAERTSMGSGLDRASISSKRFNIGDYYQLLSANEARLNR